MPVDLHPSRTRKRVIDLDGLVIATLGVFLIAIVIGLVAVRPRSGDEGGPHPISVAGGS